MTSAQDCTRGELAMGLQLTRPGGGPDAAHAAGLAAEAAARAAGVHIREITELDVLADVYRLYDGIWRPDPKNAPVTTELLRALTKAGNYVSGAFDGGVLVGACVGFFSAPAGAAMHSHIAGVAPVALGRNVGFALKLHQRAWAMRHGVSHIAWTFDPLVSRNAYFNLAKLGATADEYLPNFYGGMNDAINGDGDTDRLLVQWDLYSEDVAAACSGRVRIRSAEAERSLGAAVALGRSPEGKPVPGTLTGETILVAVPPDIEVLRAADPDCAHAWRLAVRDVVCPVMAAGWHVAGFDRSGWYIITRRSAEQENSR